MLDRFSQCGVFVVVEQQEPTCSCIINTSILSGSDSTSLSLHIGTQSNVGAGLMDILPSCGCKNKQLSPSPSHTSLVTSPDRNYAGSSRMCPWSGTRSRSAQEPTPWCGASLWPSSAWAAWWGPSPWGRWSTSLAGDNIWGFFVGAMQVDWETGTYLCSTYRDYCSCPSPVPKYIINIQTSS